MGSRLRHGGCACNPFERGRRRFVFPPRELLVRQIAHDSARAFERCHDSRHIRAIQPRHRSERLSLRPHAIDPSFVLSRAHITQLLLPRADKPGRVAVYEIMINTPSIGALIRDNKTFRIGSDIQTGGKYGMVTLDGYLVEKYQKGLISREDCITKSYDPTTMIQKLQEMDAAGGVQ